MKKLKVEIIRETKKSKLVRDDQGREGWVQNRSFKNGEVNESVFLKGVDFLQERKQIEENKREYNNTYHKINVDRETEKAVGMKVEVLNVSLDKSISKMVWFPKSQVVDNSVKGWLINAKKKEILDSFSFNMRGSLVVQF